ncbi:hypothetical protein N9017_02210 [Akkermansiaceae bacterium]|nr:hypothetical protein [Akkermansiaceae bacterium]MDB4488909.1 hypothetical protein [Akkermansiaceae bacterium]
MEPSKEYRVTQISWGKHLETRLVKASSVEEAEGDAFSEGKLVDEWTDSEHIEYETEEVGGTNAPVIDEELAKAFLKAPENVRLSKATEITEAAAESLSKHEGKLFLHRLTELSDAAAESLSKHKGGLSLGGLTELSDAAAESLSKLQGKINHEDSADWAESRRLPSWDEVHKDRTVIPNKFGYIKCPDCGLRFQEKTIEWKDGVASHGSCVGGYFKKPRIDGEC